MKSLDPLRRGLADQAPELRRAFDAARPFRHLVIDEFFAPEFCRELAEAFPSFNETQALNEFGEPGGKAVCENLPKLGEPYRRFDRLIASARFLRFLSAATGIADLLYDPDYVGGGTHENRRGQDLDPHIDFNYHPKTRLHRRLNLILFLNREWDAAWGGALELHRDPWNPEQDEVSSLPPSFNRAVVFETSERSWHGFRRIEPPREKGAISRRSIAVYFYTKQRPAEETAPEHSTLYVPRPLPERIRPGLTLSEEDCREIGDLLARRNRQIRFLYERETRFNRMIADIEASPTFRAARWASAPLRKLRDWLGKREAERRG